MSESLPPDALIPDESPSPPAPPLEASPWVWGTGQQLALLLWLGIVGWLAYGGGVGWIPLLISGGGTALLGMGAVPLLRRLKTGQVIREDGPQSHLKKAGTPTMGGIYFVPVGLLVAVIWTQANPQVLAVAVLTLAYGWVGWLDDWQVIRQQSNKGLTPRQKFLWQIGIGGLFALWLAWSGIPWHITLPWLGTVALGWGFWPLVLFVLVGTNNAVNITDGVDGLAAGVVALMLVGLGLLAVDPNLAIFGFCLAGSCLGFLAHNRNPAQVFMGDTGSLALGGALAGMALLGDSLWALALMGGILVMEALSVILQVSYFKYTKRRTGQGQRLFKMSPLHHHLELSGWSERRVVATFYGVTAILVWLGCHFSQI
ncbi:MAG: phospho-N-acetylmuramoyl-pentapeptide-transferase [Cyanobacteriota bacterium]|nr:phospho-N-acetylmuramoyl-pentapeptide-transferase [Cyanobacteriota bacterium]